MNRIFIVLVFIFPLFSLFGQKTDSICRWSVSAGVGPSVFDGDVSQSSMQVFPTSFQEVSYGLLAEYNFSPIWGLSLDFYHFPLSGENTNIRFFTPLSSVNLNATVNFTKIIFPNNPNKLSIIANLGLGYALYTSYFRYPDPDNSPEETLTGAAITIPIAFDLEYNISKKIAIGGRIQYRSLNKDNLEGATAYNYKGVTNDFIGAASLYVRYKIISKGKTHIRNLNNVKTTNAPTTIIVEKIKDNPKADSLLTLYGQELKDQDRKIDSLIMLLSKKDQKHFEVDSTVYVKKQSKIPVITTPVITAEVAKIFNEALQGIQFETNKDVIKPSSFYILDKVVSVMKNNPSYKLEINGHTDNQGSASSNLILSQKRSEAVKQYLISKGVSKNRLFPKGFGITQPIADNNTPEGRAINRRVEFKVIL